MNLCKNRNNRTVTLGSEILYDDGYLKNYRNLKIIWGGGQVFYSLALSTTDLCL